MSALFQPPEFELRCDGFILEVKTSVIPNYPTLFITAKNSTKQDIEMLSEHIRLFTDITPPNEIEKNIRLLKRKAAKSDKLSAFLNYAEVDIQGWNQTDGNRVKQAMLKIAKIALKYHPENAALISYLDDPNYPGVHLSYTFQTKKVLQTN